MTFPPEVERYVEATIIDSKRPFCLRLDRTGRVVETWGAAAEYGLDCLRPGDDACDHAPFLGACLDGTGLIPFITDSHGHSFHAHLLGDNDGLYVLLIDAQQELEERRRAQQKANEVKLLLERERRMLAELVDAKAELTQRRKEAEAESRRRGEYIAKMSHEFRTPLMALLAHAERLGQATLPQEAGQAAEAVRRIAQQQIWLVDNLMTGARLEADGFAIHAQPTNLRALVDDLSVVFAPLAADAALSFAAYVEERVPHLVVIDDLHLRQVLINLLGNAIKFTAEGGVSVGLDYRGGELHAAVVDTGPGISSDDQSRLFVSFQRGGTTPRTSGAGLGLAITRALVDAMGGALRLDSVVGRGTRIDVEIAAPEVPASAGQAASGAVSILIGEDDPDVADLLALKLAATGHAVRVVDNGREVVAVALSEGPDLIILDTNLRGLDGPTAARRLREQGFTAPILALSAASRARDIEYALASGCTDFLRKPAHPETLKRVVHELVLKCARPSRA